ncbi:ABC transporter ATP-binding protein [Clostridium oryzae]|uniref:Spermidine/putrescine import ATP-binding protein PotA n=1 Tax=Clostridium oryzae TaxID=1450648 RepID=A0A1V4IQH3_9CLOT|nr:ABC transporter ATP-binding protein [Clostridium oryzae]OPJ62278.1 spermidine/putrescine import ATP-binding protein PotA [Clostridium oryzae]
MAENMVELVNVVKKFQENSAAVDNINLTVKQGEFLTLLGPSGCGKTTTLRMIAGFEEPTDGRIMLDSMDVSAKQPYERDINTVFQNYALFPHMNIYENIAFGLRIKKVKASEIEDRVNEALRLVRLEGYGKRMPSQLSGGQKQRVAIARAIVNNPKVLLLDEPLGALDLKLRKEMQFELKHLQQKLGITFIYVTHDQEEALVMSDRIVVMNKGKIEQVGLPGEIYERPKTKFVADFIGETNIFSAEIEEVEEDMAVVKLENGDCIHVEDADISDSAFKTGDSVFVTIRPEKMKLAYEIREGKNKLRGRVKERIYVGSVNKTVITLDNGREVIVNEPSDSTFALKDSNDEVYITWDYEQGVVLTA